MKIAITASKPGKDASVDPRFGRAKWFLLVDTETGESESIDNVQNVNAMQGAGIQAAQTVASNNAKCVLTGHCGPKAFTTLTAAGIKVVTGVSGPIEKAIEDFVAGNLQTSGGPDVEGHWV
ncbi:NifB/NifX family molybdenum-iron cluster-binding protein [Candidatus Hydrogenedentota bacterium]